VYEVISDLEKRDFCGEVVALLAVSERRGVAGIFVTAGNAQRVEGHVPAGRRRRDVVRLLQAVGTTCLIAAVVGCGSENKPVVLISQTPSVPIPSQDARGTAEQSALDAYRGMWRAYAKAGLKANPDEPDLAHYASGAALKTLTSGLAAYRNKGQVLKGEYVSVPQTAGASLDTTPSTVTVADCLDDSHFLVYDAAGKRVDDEAGGRRATRATVSDLGTEGWKVTSFGIQEVGTC
jgi:hypothetical protein